MTTTRNLEEILRSPGRLCANPTDLSAEFPHGGTDLGNIRACAVREAPSYKLITAEEFGGRVVEGVYTGKALVLAVIFRGLNDAAAELAHPNTRAGAQTGRRVIFEPYPSTDSNVLREGRRLSARAVTLYFSPLDYHRGVAVLLQKALPMLAESQELALQAQTDLETAAVFTVAPLLANKEPYQAGNWRDLVLG